MFLELTFSINCGILILILETGNRYVDVRFTSDMVLPMTPISFFVKATAAKRYAKRPITIIGDGALDVKTQKLASFGGWRSP